MPPQLPYLAYIAVTVFGPAAVLCGVVAMRRDRIWQRSVGVAVVATIAFLYTTPWDAMLIRLGVWWYGDGVVTARIGAIPIGEYCFFVLQPILTGAIFHLLVPTVPDDEPRMDATRGAGLGLFSVVAICGWALTTTTWGFYLGWILMWASPVVAFLCGVVGDVLWRVRGQVLAVLFASTTYLWLVDWFAIDRGLWTIAPALSTGLTVAGLPIEEMTFFAVTNLLVVSGVLGYEWVCARSIRVGLIDGLAGLAPVARHGFASDRSHTEAQISEERP
jgi:lycopene cyclase domain-containing protein